MGMMFYGGYATCEILGIMIFKASLFVIAVFLGSFIFWSTKHIVEEQYKKQKLKKKK